MKFKTARMFYLGLAALFLGACKPAGSPAEPVFEGAWVRPLPPGMHMTAGFGTLTNVTGQEIEIESVSSPAFGSVSLHRTEVVDGVSSMTEVESLSLGAGESLEMAPGGYHLMLMMPQGPVHEGDRITVVFHATDGRAFGYEVPAEKR